MAIEPPWQILQDRVATLGGSGGDTAGSAGRTLAAEEAWDVTVLVAAASKYGSTAEIAEAIGRALRENGVAADMRPVDEVGDRAGYTRQPARAWCGDRAWSEAVWGYAAFGVMVMGWPSSASRRWVRRRAAAPTPTTGSRTCSA